MSSDKKPTKKKGNFEPFDVWGAAQFAMWSNVRYDFELTAELTRRVKSTKECLELMQAINGHLKNNPGVCPKSCVNEYLEC